MTAVSQRRKQRLAVSVCDSPRKHGKGKEKVHASCVSVDGRLSIHGKGKEKGQKINVKTCGQKNETKFSFHTPILNGLTEGMNGKETQNLLGLEKPTYFTEPFIEFQPLLGSSFNSLDHSIIVGDTEGCMRMT